jgi:hypothetical protein
MLLCDDGTKEHRDTQITSQFGCLPGRCVVPQPEAGYEEHYKRPKLEQVAEHVEDTIIKIMKEAAAG